MINLTNYSDHPTRIGHTVFKFKQQERASYFKTLLKQEDIWYESSNEEDDSIYLFGVKKGDFKKVMKVNYLVSAKYRKRTIPNKYVSIGTLIIVIALLTIAIIGAIKT